MIIAIDGPAASGKGTLARAVAAHFGLRHLDTGLLYRAVAKAMIEAGHDLDDGEIAAKAAEGLDLASLDREVLSVHRIGEAASRVAAIPAVRAVLMDAQRSFARAEPGAVLDGRDIGTVICPEADAKLFVDASVEVRARRRAKEMAGRGIAISEDEVLADLKARDARDASRSDAPMTKAADAYLLDTSDKSIDAAIALAVDYINRASNR